MTFQDMLNIGMMQGFAGLSLFSVLLLMGLGLAVIFGQMGVINMAHGEFMTIGAYTIFLGSTLSDKIAPGWTQAYFPLAICAAFVLYPKVFGVTEGWNSSGLCGTAAPMASLRMRSARAFSASERGSLPLPLADQSVFSIWSPNDGWCSSVMR